MEVRFFESAAEFRAWLAENHDSDGELWLGIYKKASGKPSITYREALDECLCFGWIDGVRHAMDADHFAQRFTRRRPRSNWSAVNIKRVQELLAEGRMQPPGIEAFEARDRRDPQYSYENRPALSAEYEARLKQRRKAWEFFEAQSPWYRRTVSHWVMSAKREETRLKRLDQLADDSEAGLWVAPVRSAQPGNRKAGN
ncbi:MAG TPA: YdeI/OmpD-associated family protein [Dehalococcoidia bacterium]|nr:YdeI/OmpD-associated family protein [Dehalococcoidia bacterium]